MITGIDDYNRLEKFFDTAAPLKITLQIDGSAAYDFCCFGVDADEKLSDDRYMIFYNQLSSPNDEIIGAEIPFGMEFTVNLDALPSTICKLVFTCSIDGAGTMNEISRHKIFVGEKISAEFVGADFKHKKKSIVSLEIYRNDGWRFNVAAREFGGGLDALLNFYGGEQIDDGGEIFYKVGGKNMFGEKFSSVVDSVKSNVSVAAVGGTVKNVAKHAGKSAVKGAVKSDVKGAVSLGIAGAAVGITALAPVIATGAVVGIVGSIVDKVLDDD